MSLEGTDPDLREHLSELLGRPLSDEEWDALKDAQRQEAAGGGSGATTRRRRSATDRTALAQGVALWLVYLIGASLVGALFTSLLVDIGWAFGLEKSRIGVGSPAQFAYGVVIFGLLLGLPLVSRLPEHPAALWIAIGGMFFVGLVVLVLGLIIHLV